MTTKVGVTSLIGYIHRLPLVNIVVTSGHVVASSNILFAIDNGNNNVMISAVSPQPPSNILVAIDNGNNNVIISAVSPQHPNPKSPCLVKSIFGIHVGEKSNSNDFLKFQYKRKILRLKLYLSAELISSSRFVFVNRTSNMSPCESAFVIATLNVVRSVVVVEQWSVTPGSHVMSPIS